MADLTQLKATIKNADTALLNLSAAYKDGIAELELSKVIDAGKSVHALADALSTGTPRKDAEVRHVLASIITEQKSALADGAEAIAHQLNADSRIKPQDKMAFYLNDPAVTKATFVEQSIERNATYVADLENLAKVRGIKIDTSAMQSRLDDTKLTAKAAEETLRLPQGVLLDAATILSDSQFMAQLARTHEDDKAINVTDLLDKKTLTRRLTASVYHITKGNYHTQVARDLNEQGAAAAR